MHVTLHLTTGCNLNCGYCYAPPVRRQDMTEDIARKSVEYCRKIAPLNAGIIFFGGEPLMRKDLIRSAISYCHELEKRDGGHSHFKVTTNGTLLDEEFLDYCREVRLSVALSCDGTRDAHDYHRRFPSGAGSFDIVDSKLELLLKYQPYASCYLVVTHETVDCYYESVRYLFAKGVRYIVASLNYAGNWTEGSLRTLRRQYTLLAKLYEGMTLDQRKFYFSPFETKLASHIKNEDGTCDKCHLGMRQISVGPDGSIYPCVQFVGREEYRIGDVESGIDFAKRNHLHELSTEPATCAECSIQPRCRNRCSCLNIQTTGEINVVSPVLCETERMLTPIVDRVGERLVRKKAPMFIQKHYNAVYPILSLYDDSH
ncbi:MAG: radical SAM protein [Bacteroidota bacterium]|jgi:uncharacterized protein